MLKPVQHDKLYNASHCKSKCAFTLAEVLITLVIIGVIAALTIPNLMQKYQEQATVKKVQNFYSNLSNAYSLALKENGTIDEWELGLEAYTAQSAEKIYELLFKPYFKIAKNCGTTNTGNCISNNRYKLLNNTDSNYYGSSSAYKITLDDGAALWWSKFGTIPSYINIYYDVNGHKEPNQWGKDLFEFYIKENKVLTSGIPSGTYAMQSFNMTCNRTGPGYGCSAWLIYKGNMDYLHCDGLTWNSRSCKDK